VTRREALTLAIGWGDRCAVWGRTHLSPCLHPAVRGHHGRLWGYPYRRSHPRVGMLAGTDHRPSERHRITSTRTHLRSHVTTRLSSRLLHPHTGYSPIQTPDRCGMRSAYPVCTTSKSSNCGGGSDGVRRLAALARYTTKESWDVNGMSVPWGDAKRVGYNTPWRMSSGINHIRRKTSVKRYRAFLPPIV
jgi:hypothetical protein